VTTASQRPESGQMTINFPNVIKILGTSLYSDPKVSIRELIQNANDTCVVRQVQDQSAPSSRIDIRYDTWKNQLIVEDNGAGMTADEVRQFLTVIGSSNTEEIRQELERLGKLDDAQRLIGRFGLGLLSAFIIGDSIEFVTLSYKEGSEPVSWQCDGGQEYRMGLPAQPKSTPGTTVTVHVNEKYVGLLNDDALRQLIRRYADFLSIPIYLGHSALPINAMSAPWDRQATEAEYQQFVQERYPNEAILGVIPLEIEEDEGNFKVGGVLFVPKQPLFIVKEHGDATIYVRRMFVCEDDRSLLPEWAKFVRGTVESPNLRETTSREAILHDENFVRVQKAIGKAILDYLNRIAVQDTRQFREIVTNHNLVIKAWAIESDELFDRIQDIVLFTSDAGMVSLPRYFDLSQRAAAPSEDKRYIFYFTTPGGAGQHTMLFAAKGLRVIDAHYFPDDGFLRKYADRHPDVILKRLDVGGDFIFEELEHRETKWVELEEEYSHQRIEARVVRFVPEDIPAVLIYPEVEPVGDQIDTLLADPNLSAALKNMVKQMWDDRERQRKNQLSAGGVLYVNASNPVIQKIVDLDLRDYEVQEVLIVIYNNALMLSTQGARMALTPDNAKKVFESNNRAINALINKIYQVRDLQARQAKQLYATGTTIQGPAIGDGRLSTPTSVEDLPYLLCLVALPNDDLYDRLFRALCAVLDVYPYFWRVERADRYYDINNPGESVRTWVARARCFGAEISIDDSMVMMILGHVVWSYPDRALFLLQQSGPTPNHPEFDPRPRIFWNTSVDPNTLISDLRTEFQRHPDLRELRGKEHYLSVNTLRNLVTWIPEEVAGQLSNDYPTIEQFVKTPPAEIASRIRRKLREGSISDLQQILRDHCDLPADIADATDY
jgi:molecular chaperone HtpG